MDRQEEEVELGPNARAHTSLLPSPALALAADSASTINDKVVRADAAQKSWAKTTFRQRRAVLRSLLGWVTRDMESIAKVGVRDTGKTSEFKVFQLSRRRWDRGLADINWAELQCSTRRSERSSPPAPNSRSVQLLSPPRPLFLDPQLISFLLRVVSWDIQWLINHGERWLSPESREGNWILSHKVSKVSRLPSPFPSHTSRPLTPCPPCRLFDRHQVHYEPLGTVAACVSWNYPFHNSLSQITAALFSGNALVLKCSEQVAWSSAYFVDVVRQCLEEHGFDPEILQVRGMSPLSALMRI